MRRPASRIAEVVVVSGGTSVSALIEGMRSSWATTDTSVPTPRPASRMARQEPSASSMLEHRIAVGGASSAKQVPGHAVAVLLAHVALRGHAGRRLQAAPFQPGAPAALAVAGEGEGGRRR